MALIIAFLALIAGLAWVANNRLRAENEKVGRQRTAKIVLGDQIITAKIANSTKSREIGLSGQEKLASSTALIMIYPFSDYHQIWMKEMLFPIDVIWLDAKGKIVDIKPQIATSTFPESFGPRNPARYVLEVASGTAQEFNLKIGQKIGLN